MRHSVHLHLPFHTHHRQARYDVDMTQGSITKHLINFSLPLLLGYTGLDDALLKKYIADSRALWEGHEDALHCVQVGSVIGVHGGPGAVVCAYFAAG